MPCVGPTANRHDPQHRYYIAPEKKSNLIQIIGQLLFRKFPILSFTMFVDLPFQVTSRESLQETA